jgi:hypothetical protein
MVSAAPAEIINAFFVDSRPFLGTFLASRRHPGQRLGYLGWLITKRGNLLSSTGVQ